MEGKMSRALISDLEKKEYHVWLKNLKEKVRSVQIKAAIKVNSELLMFYWELGRDIVNMQKSAKWGDGFLTQLNTDLIAEFPEMKGFSLTNLKYIKRWYLFYSLEIEKSQQVVDQLSQTVEINEPNNDRGKKSVIGQHVIDLSAPDAFRQQVVAQIIQIPWGHNIAIITKCKNIEEAAFYVQQTLQHNWSRSLLVHQIESNLFERKGKSITRHLPDEFRSPLPSIEEIEAELGGTALSGPDEHLPEGWKCETGMNTEKMTIHCLCDEELMVSQNVTLEKNGYFPSLIMMSYHLSITREGDPMNKTVETGTNGYGMIVVDDIQRRIYTIRGVQVMLDKDLAELYQVETKVLNQAMKRNRNRFPESFCFQLNDEEFEILKSQIVTTSWGGRRTNPYAFTEQGIGAMEMLAKLKNREKVKIDG